MTEEGMSGLAVHSIKREAGTGGPVPGHGIPVVATASRFTAPVHIIVIIIIITIIICSW